QSADSLSRTREAKAWHPPGSAIASRIAHRQDAGQLLPIDTHPRSLLLDLGGVPPHYSRPATCCRPALTSHIVHNQHAADVLGHPIAAGTILLPPLLDSRRSDERFVCVVPSSAAARADFHNCLRIRVCSRLETVS